jgi:probable DNA metabolism protein
MSLSVWAYDGSLEGLVLLARKAYAEGLAPANVTNPLAADGELFALAEPESFDLAAAYPSAEALASAAQGAGAELRAFSGELFDMILRIWMSEEGLERELLFACAQASLHGPEVLADHGSAETRKILAASNRVSHEIHRLEGLARFSPRSDGLLCAQMEPDANVVAALLPYFSRRFGGEDFALLDLRRNLAFARLGGRYESASGEAALAYLPAPESSQDEDTELWRRYFKATENPARKNPSLQRRLMPARYWRYLPEIAIS